MDTFRIGPHTPTMKNEDVVLLHRLWLKITREQGLENVHHHDILTEALTRFAHDYGARDREDIVKNCAATTPRAAQCRSAESPIRFPTVQSAACPFRSAMRAYATWSRRGPEDDRNRKMFRSRCQLGKVGLTPRSPGQPRGAL